MRYSKGGIGLGSIQRMTRHDRSDWCRAFAELVKEERAETPKGGGNTTSDD
jgi:hypothetical protein